MLLLGIGMPGPMEMALIGALLLIFFGAGKLPQAGQSIGLGIRNFKKAMNSKEEDDEVDVTPKKKKKADAVAAAQAALKAAESADDEEEESAATEKAKG